MPCWPLYSSENYHCCIGCSCSLATGSQGREARGREAAEGVSIWSLLVLVADHIHCRYNRDVKSGIILLDKVPRIWQLMGSKADDADEKLKDYLSQVSVCLTYWYSAQGCASQLRRGGAVAWSDDFNGIRDLLVDWIDAEFDPPHNNKIFHRNCNNQGLANDLIGKLLCPYMLNWDDPK